MYIALNKNILNKCLLPYLLQMIDGHFKKGNVYCNLKQFKSNFI